VSPAQAGHPGLPEHRGGGRSGQPRPLGPEGGSALGQGQHCSLGWGPGAGHPVWRERRVHVRQLPPCLSAGSFPRLPILPPQSRGLFHRAILQSGTAISPYTAPRRSPGEYAEELAAAAGCGDKDTLSCLQALPARKLYLHLSLFQSCSVRQDLGIIYPAPWVPWVDATLKEPFLPK